MSTVKLTKSGRFSTANMWASRIAIAGALINAFIGIIDNPYLAAGIVLQSVVFGAFMYATTYIIYIIFFKFHLRLVEDFKREAQAETSNW